MEIKMLSLDDFDYRGKTVLLRIDINSPLDRHTGKISSDNRIRKSLPTIRSLLDAKAKLVMIAHQGDTLDYHNLISLAEHAEKLSEMLGQPVSYIDDVCGLAACNLVKALKTGQAVLLGNLRYLTEEVSGFEKEVTLEPKQMLQTWLVRQLAPLCDHYVNDAFSAAHRNSPSMVAFQELLPTAGGRLLYQEYAELSRLVRDARRPLLFLLGGAKISDAFGMLYQVLERSIADRVLTCGVVGQVFLIAAGRPIGRKTEQWLSDKDFVQYIDLARKFLDRWGDRIEMPRDLINITGEQTEVLSLASLPRDDAWIGDIGPQTCTEYIKMIAEAATLFINGPAGIYENPLTEAGTRCLLQAAARSAAYSVIGGGDTVQAAARFAGLDQFSYVCTAGGAMVQFMSGDPLPLLRAMEKAWQRDRKKPE